MVLRNCGKELTINMFVPTNSSENAVSIYTTDGNLLSSEKMVPGIINSVKIQTHNMGLILDFIVEVEKTSIPAELEPNSSDTKKLGAIITDVKFH